MDGFRTHHDDIAAQASLIPEKPLGPYGDIPAPFAIFKVVSSDSGKEGDRHFYVYANPAYCELVDCELDAIVGCSHLEVVKFESEEWSHNCYRAAVLGETVNSVEYNALALGWVSYIMAPAAIDECCVCTFIPIDDRERGRQMSVDARTTQVISEMLGALAGENGYEVAMNSMLEMAADVVKPDRLIVFECRGEETEHTFEWCAEGVESHLGTVYKLPSAVLNAWFKSVVKDPVALVPDVALLSSFSRPLFDWCLENGVERFLAAPFFNEGNVVGFLGAYNYRIDDTIDVNRVFGAVSSFVGAKIENHRLLEHLVWTSNHDALTGLFNRRGAKAAFEHYLEEGAGQPCALVLVDIDDFKAVNDRFGHAAGDAALMATANAMRAVFPQDAALCRMGGDEFVAAFVGEQVGMVDELVGRFAVDDVTYEHEGARHRLTISVGYATYPDQAADRDELYARADAALYAVKRAGKSGVRRYSPEM